MVRVLLVEPSYYTRFPPLGLLKLASYHRDRGDVVQFVRGCQQIAESPNLVYVTSLFTWSWRQVWDAVKYYKGKFPQAEIWLGGLYASLLPKHAKESGADHVHIGLFEECEDFIPAYDLVPEWDGSIIYASRGCGNRCQYCAVWRLEGGIGCLKWDIKRFVYPKHTRIFFWDNNLLQAPNWRIVFDDLAELSKQKKIKVDFNQGLDAKLFNEEVVEKLTKINLMCLRLSYDKKKDKEAVRKAIELLVSSGIRGRKIIVYVLYNWNEDPDDFFLRVRDILEWGAVVFPMRYQPLDALEKNTYISPFWDSERLDQFEKFRRVCGYAGTLPPYRWLREKILSSTSFDESFKPPPPIPENKELKRAHKDYYSSWARQMDWRTTTQHLLARRW
jgi:hypothetical protein